MKKYSVIKKLDYNFETKNKKHFIDKICKMIHQCMKDVSFSFVDIESSPNIIFSIGGDGTMMHTLKENIINDNDSIVIGVHAGNLGFLTPYVLKDIENKNIMNDILDIYSNNSRVENRFILEANYKNKTYYSVNEFSLCSTEINRIINVELSVNDNGVIKKMGLHRANNLLVSSPIGSTAFNMNAGGALIDPSNKCMQLLFVAPTNISNRPIVLNESSVLTIRSLDDNIAVFSDDTNEIILNKNDEISVKMSDRSSKILLPKDWNFYNNLSQKMYWNMK